MDFKQLETFITIVKTKSFTKTADVLYITQPSVTNHIQALESELNTSLFVRTRRSVTLTQAGSIVYKHALNILASYDEIIRDLDIYSQNLKGTLNICVSSVPRKIILPNLIEKFSNLFPDISFNISNDDSRTVIDSILVGETDFGIVGLKISNPKLIYTQIMDDHIVYVVNKDAYPDLKNYSVINIEDLSNDKIILREIGSGTRQIVEDELKRNNSLNVISNSVATIHDTNTILELISKGVGSGFISQRMLNISPYKDRVKILNIKNLYLNRKFYFVYNKNLQFSNINKIFKILLPITFPKTMSPLPDINDFILTANSGALVPKATIVSPINIFGTLKLPATALAPSTKISAPLIKIIKPTIKNTKFNIIYPPYYYLFK